MFSLMSKLAGSILMSAATLTNPTTPSALPFDASAFVTASNQIRLSVNKTADVQVTVLLRNANHQVLFQQNIGKKESTYAVKLNVDDLTDGQYELEVKSKEGSIRKELNLSTQPVKQTARVIAMQ